MDFHLSSEQIAFADALHKLGKDKLAPGALSRNHSPDYPWEIAEILSQQGLLGITLKEVDGGMGGTLMDAVIAIQTIALYCPKSADIVQAGNFGPIRSFAEYATEDQKERYLPDLLAGKAVISLGMTEPDAGSAVTELTTNAKKVEGGYLVNGSKVFSTHSPDAKVFLIYLRYGPGLDGIGSMLIERDTPGFEIGQPSSFMSGERWSQLYFADCFVPDKNVLLGPGGFKKQISGFNVERIGNASRSLALGRYTFLQAKEYAKNRTQFSRKIAEFQGIQWKFAEMATKLKAAQLLLYKAALNADSGLPSPYETAMAKLICNETGFNVANEALQIMGASGYSQENLVEYCVRRTRGWMIAGGSIEILKNRIAEEVLEMRFDQRPPKAKA
jgi:alkylation response protein AidB-like acyl-CoA dehydrogenase